MHLPLRGTSWCILDRDVVPPQGIPYPGPLGDVARSTDFDLRGASVSLITTFADSDAGVWEVVRLEPVAGESLESIARLDVFEGSHVDGARWTLRGVPSYERYVTRVEQQHLTASSPPLGRHEATRAALIPIRKSAAWWDLPQDERREIFEERSRHIATGLKYLPAVARRLYHGRDLGEPFDFLTWFEYEPGDEDRFEELVLTLRATPEWAYVEREVDIRLSREPG